MKRDALHTTQDFIGSVETDMTQGTEIIMRQSQWSVTHFMQYRILLETDMTQGTDIIMRQSHWSVTHFRRYRILLVL